MVLKAAVGEQHLLVCGGGRDLQLSVSGESILMPVRLSADALWPAAEIRHRWQALECLNALHLVGRLPARLYRPDPRGPRLSLVLRALDGALSGASHREIATAVFGEARVEADWTHPGDHLRDRIRRAVRRGRSLMNGGYRSFLI
ncbi:DNA -binding domain-containing protein [Amorphus sp. MBR-141]